MTSGRYIRPGLPAFHLDQSPAIAMPENTASGGPITATELGWINPPAKLSTIQYTTSQPVHIPALMQRDTGAPALRASDQARTRPATASGSSQANWAAARGRNRRSGPVGESSVITGCRTSAVAGLA